LGDYTAPQSEGHVATILDGIRRAYPHAQVNYERGCAVRDTSSNSISKAVELAENSEVTILVVGGSSARDFKTSYLDTGAARVDGQTTSDMDCGEGYDRSKLQLLGHQNRLMQALVDAQVPLVVIYVQGRPLDMNLASERANALLTCWYPGEAGGEAVADILTGKANPSGKLSISIPRNVGQLPVHYSRIPSHDYTDGPSSPLYSFGYGLSYSKFTKGKSTASGNSISCTITNDSDREGTEVAQLYAVNQRTKQRKLVDFRRVAIPAHASVTVTFETEKPTELTNYVIE